MCDAAEIQKCLNCTRPRCNNCLERVPSKRSQRNILRIDLETGEVTGIYPTLKEAGCKNDMNPDSIRFSAKNNTPRGGYQWKVIVME